MAAARGNAQPRAVETHLGVAGDGKDEDVAVVHDVEAHVQQHRRAAAHVQLYAQQHTVSELK